MNYIGCDVHKYYTVLSILDEKGTLKKQGRVYNNIEGFKELLDSKEEYKAVLESGLNWGVIHDMLEEIENIKEIKVANAGKVKAIASAKIKTDKIDSKILAQLLRVDLIPEVWIPKKEIRALKDLVRYRAYIVKLRTMTKNRIHDVLLKNHVVVPAIKDIFGKYGMSYLNRIELKNEVYNKIFKHHLELLKGLMKEEKRISKIINIELKENKYYKLLQTVPGIGNIFASIIALEIGDINRFENAKKLCSYAGLVPSTHSSGQTHYHGRLIKGNKWLRWAFIEASHSAIRGSIYFRKHNQKVKIHKDSKAAAVSTARKIATIVFKILKENREYVEL